MENRIKMMTSKHILNALKNGAVLIHNHSTGFNTILMPDGKQITNRRIRKGSDYVLRKNNEVKMIEDVKYHTNAWGSTSVTIKHIYSIK